MAPTPREVAHAKTMARILDAARAELARHGPTDLSVRAIARDVGMVSSAVYRYVATRDELLTELIVAGYQDLGDQVAQATSGRGTPGRRFVRGCEAARTWAVGSPHEHALLFGSPVPGYSAPQRTAAAAARTPLALIGTVQDAFSANTLSAHQDSLPAMLRKQAREAADQLRAPELPDDVILRFGSAWAQALGVIGLERSGYFVGTFDPIEQFATATFREGARHIGFTDL
ncbi:TetR/AcrR family transcriptional regulator [Dermacoccaceae bacterium W4C1]